ncbi:MAG: glycosyltransferase family 2 protein [Bacteroidales bacterium]|nr:glycosyltransferase family 2 protein [Bacteroidales bacterium]
MEENMPLVSVAVITYNSSKYVLETLESIKAQTYKNIELIISDDCSTDNTMQLCKKWCKQHKERFARIQYVEVEQNTGVSANCNRAEDACEAEWVKLIAGDDMLLPNCITDFMEYVKNNVGAVYVFGKVKFLGGTKDNIDYSIFVLKTAEEQLKKLVLGTWVPACTCFYDRIRSKKEGLMFDERIPMFEDTPKWINVLKKGIPLNFIDKYVCVYRVGHNESLSSGNLHYQSFMRSKRLVYFYYLYPELVKINNQKAVESVVDFEMRWYNNYFEIMNSTTYKVGSFVLSPFRVLKKLCKSIKTRYVSIRYIFL